MAYTKRYRTIVPLEPGRDAGDLDVVRWLTRESFERTAADEFLTLREYAEGPIPAGEVPPKLGELLGRPVAEFDWWLFTGVASA